MRKKINVKKGPTFSRWIVACESHKGNCDYLLSFEPQDLSFKEGPCPAVFRGSPAFFLRFSGGVGFQYVNKHFPQSNSEHRFKLTPIPRGVKAIKVNEVYVVQEEMLNEFTEKVLNAHRKGKKELEEESDCEAELDEEALDGDEEGETIAQSDESDAELQESEERISKKVKRTMQQEVPDLNVYQEIVVHDEIGRKIQIITRERKARSKRNRPRPMKIDDILAAKSKTKPRKSKPKKKVDKIDQHEQAIKLIDRRLNYFERELVDVKKDQTDTLRLISNLADANRMLKQNVEEKINELGQPIRIRLPPNNNETVAAQPFDTLGQTLPQIEEF